MWFLQTKLFIFPSILFLIQYSVAIETDFTVNIAPGTQECFYEFLKDEVTELDIEYQVIDGGDLDINFMMQSPTDKILVSEKRESEGTHSFIDQPSGTYKFCFDNTFSRMSSKRVFFEIITNVYEEEDLWFQNAEDELEELKSLVDMKIKDFKLLVDRVKKNIDKSLSIQQILRVFEARDRGIQEDNFLRVNWFSGVYLFIMVSVGLTQVVMIRSIFDDNSKLNRIMRSRT